MTNFFRYRASAPMNRPAANSVRGGLAFGLGAVVFIASGCGSSTPTKAEFIAEVRTTLGSDLATGEGLDVDPGELQQLVDDFLGCTYDAIKGDEALLQQMFKDPSFSSATTDQGAEQQATLSQLTTECTSELNNAATEAPSGEE